MTIFGALMMPQWPADSSASCLMVPLLWHEPEHSMEQAVEDLSLIILAVLERRPPCLTAPIMAWVPTTVSLGRNLEWSVQQVSHDAI